MRYSRPLMTSSNRCTCVPVARASVVDVWKRGGILAGRPCCSSERSIEGASTECNSRVLFHEVVQKNLTSHGIHRESTIHPQVFNRAAAAAFRRAGFAYPGAVRRAGGTETKGGWCTLTYSMLQRCCAPFRRLIRTAGRSIVLALIALAAVVSPCDAAEADAVLYRIFLRDGSTLVSFGEFAQVADRVVFSMPIGGTDANPVLHL